MNKFEIVQELLNLVNRKKLKEGTIDTILNNYVEINNVPMEYRNALRHRGGSALMSNFTEDVDKAKFWGNAKEAWDLTLGKENDSIVDSLNNHLGRKIYEQHKNLPPLELVDKVYENILQNPNPYGYFDTNNVLFPAQKIFHNINSVTYPINKSIKKKY